MYGRSILVELTWVSSYLADIVSKLNMCTQLHNKKKKQVVIRRFCLKEDFVVRVITGSY